MPAATRSPRNGHRQVPSAAAIPPSHDSEPEQVPRKKREMPTRKNTNVRNLVWAIGLNIVVVALLAVIVVGLGTGSREAQPAQSEGVDLESSAERARDLFDFPVAAPLPEGWVARSSQVATSEPATWQVRYTAPDGRLVTLVQQADMGPALMSRVNGSVRMREAVSMSGVPCHWLEVDSSGTTGAKNGEGSQVGLACQADASGVVVYGGESRESVRILAEQAVRSEGET